MFFKPALSFSLRYSVNRRCRSALLRDFSSASRSSTRAFCGLSSIDATNPSLSSSSSTLRPMMPVVTREERTHTMPFFACFASVFTAASVRLPLPTPAMTMPLAPAATAASMSAPSMFS